MHSLESVGVNVRAYTVWFARICATACSQGYFMMAAQRAGITRELMLDLSIGLSSVGFSSYVQVRYLLH
jgi:hypothetical protein